MLFNSFEYIFVFLPIALAVCFLLAPINQRYAHVWIALASFAFYSWWNWRYVGILLTSLTFNFGWAHVIARSKHRSVLPLTIGIAVNLAALGFFKYAGFVADSLNAVFGTDIPVRHAELPLGISFFTFTQIAFLVDLWRRQAQEYDFVRYAMFVGFFPHLIAGPLLHHREMMPQFKDRANLRFDHLAIAVGLTVFTIGLSKKLFIADPLSLQADRIFAAAAQGQPLGFLEAWEGALRYTMQLYFDFSGYSDMALGAALMMNIRMPLNFASPYKATSLIDFWRRWHMSLSRFLRDYLYIALGGGRRGRVRRYLNLFITMLLGGLWHGAGWTFVLWGAYHGILLMLNHAWRNLIGYLGLRPNGRLRLLAGAITFAAVVIGWVIFRADHAPAAASMIGSMLGIHGIQLPLEWQARLGALAGALAALGISFSPQPLFSGIKGLYLLMLALAIVWLAPNTQEIVRWRPFDPATGNLGEPEGKRWLSWQPNAWWAAGVGTALAAGCLSLNHVTKFLYFQF
jgi:alginate O-acetyltransferase complex protein AlgI